MARIFKSDGISKVRLCAQCSLALLFLLIFSACQKQDETIELVWKNQQAIGISIPKHLLTRAAQTAPDQVLKIVLDNGHNQAILGNFVPDHSTLLFEPLIPLTPGLTYRILQDNQPIDKLFVPFDKQAKAPELVAIYPRLDTLPENLLKVYLQFSKPMRTGESLQFIHLLNKNQDTLRNVFLNLQPELWDTSGTVLTLWLDPGRIKRGLTLNRALGNPLKTNEAYQLVISSKWKDARGLQLLKKHTKTFVAGKRDEQAPDIHKWELQVPKAGTTTPLRLNTRESLDHFLLRESIGMVDQNKHLVNGKIKLEAKDQQVIFTPATPWKAQRYQLQVDARLEDLVGNNLNRVFDRDITKGKRRTNSYYTLDFEVKP